MNSSAVSNNMGSVSVTTTAATFLSLPIEIKTQIIECCKNADDNYYRRFNHESQYVSALPRLLLNGSRWQGRSLNALFSVNKELSNLCKVVLFRHLSSQHFFAGNKFIIIKHQQLFRSVTFTNHSASSELPDLCYSLSSLCNMKSMTLGLAAAVYTFGIENIRSEEELYRFNLLCSVGAAITKLCLQSYTLHHDLDILLAFPNLRILQIGTVIFPSTIDEEEDTVETSITSGIQLAKLELHSLILKLDSLGSISKQWLELDWCSNLRNLSFHAYTIDDSHLEFINKFSNSLQSLTIKGLSLSRIFGTVSPTPLPKLSHLSIELPPRFFDFMLPFFHLSCHLTTLKCESYGSIDDHSVFDQTLAVFLQPQTSLEALVICDQYFQPSKFPKVNAICAAGAIALKYQVYEDQDIEEIHDPNIILPHYQPILREALEVGTRKLEQMERESDAEGMKDMYINIKWLRATAAEMKD